MKLSVAITASSARNAVIFSSNQIVQFQIPAVEMRNQWIFGLMNKFQQTGCTRFLFVPGP